MGFGTVWRVGDPAEARLWWEDRFPPGRPEACLDFVTSLELQCLRAAIRQAPRTVAEIVREVRVEKQAYPAAGTPEWTAWYENMERSQNPIDLVLPEFVAEVRAVAGEVEAVAARWHALWDADASRTLDHAAWCVRELAAVAAAAEQEGLGVLSRTYGI